MSENFVVKDCEFNNPLIQKIESLIDDSLKDCHSNYFHTLDHICVYGIFFTNITYNETVNFPISTKNTGLYELNKKLTIAREEDFLFNQITKLTEKFCSNLSQINIHYYLKLQIPIMQRHFFTKLSQNPEYIQTHCNISK